MQRLIASEVHMSTSKRSQAVVVALAFVLAPLLVLTLGAGLSWAVRSIASRSRSGAMASRTFARTSRAIPASRPRQTDFVRARQ
jgi:hypothetical protein